MNFLKTFGSLKSHIVDSYEYLLNILKAIEHIIDFNDHTTFFVSSTFTLLGTKIKLIKLKKLSIYYTIKLLTQYR